MPLPPIECARRGHETFITPNTSHQCLESRASLAYSQNGKLYIHLSTHSTVQTVMRPPPAEIVWEKVRAWSGSGSRMLESFPSDSGMLRISWKADATALEAPGSFRVIVHSAISGRPLVVAVDEKGAGSGTAFVGDEPRMYFISIESQGLNWSLTVEERIN